MSLSQSDYAAYRRIGIVANEEYQHPTLLDFDMVTQIANDDGHGTGTPWMDLHTIPKDITDWDAVWNWHVTLLASEFLHQSVRIAKLYNSLGLEDPEKVKNPNGPGSDGETPTIPPTSPITYIFTQPDVNDKVAVFSNGATYASAIGTLNSMIGTRSFTGDPTDGFTWKDNIGRDGNYITAGSTITHNLDQLDQAIGGSETFTGYVDVNTFWNGRNPLSAFKNLEALNRAIGSRFIPDSSHLLGTSSELVATPKAGFTDSKLSVTDILNRLITTLGSRGVGYAFITPAVPITTYTGGNGVVTSATPQKLVWNAFPTTNITDAILALSNGIGDRIITSNGDSYPLSGMHGSVVTAWINSLNLAIGSRHFSSPFTGTYAISTNGASITDYLSSINIAIGSRTYVEVPGSGFVLTSTNNSSDITSALTALSTQIGNRQYSKPYITNSSTVTAAIKSVADYIDLMLSRGGTGSIATTGDLDVNGKVITNTGTSGGYTFDQNPGGGSNHVSTITYEISSGADTVLNIFNRGNTGDSIKIQAGTVTTQAGTTTLVVDSTKVTASSFKSLGAVEVVGTSTLGVVNAGATSATSLAVSGNTTLNTVSSTGLATLNSLMVTGTTNLAALNAGATSVTSLTATGATSLTTLTTSGLSTLNSLTVTGTTNLGVLNAGTTNVTNLTASGSVNSSTLNVTNSAAIGGTITASIGNIATVNSTTVNSGAVNCTTLSVTGTSNLTTLNVSGNTTVNNLTATGDITVQGDIKNTAGDIIINGSSPAVDLTALESRVTTIENTLGGATVTWASIVGKPLTFAPSAHTHLWADITDKPTSFTPAAHNHNAVYSLLNHNHSGVHSIVGHSHTWNEITSKPTSFASDWSTLANIPSNLINAATTYALAGHDHAGVYAASVHNHNSAYLSKTGNDTTTGTITASGFNVASDRRLKTDIRELNRGLAEVQALSPVRYRYTQDTRDTVRYGLIAQDVLRICPAAVSRGDNDMLSIDYAQLVPILINAIQELASRLEV